jgi:hypothetical protein
MIARKRLGGGGIVNHHYQKAEMAERRLSESIFNKLDRFPPFRPEQANRMVKVQHLARKVQGQTMVKARRPLGLC